MTGDHVEAQIEPVDVAFVSPHDPYIGVVVAFLVSRPDPVLKAAKQRKGLMSVRGRRDLGRPQRPTDS